MIHSVSSALSGLQNTSSLFGGSLLGRASNHSTYSALKALYAILELTHTSIDESTGPIGRVTGPIRLAIMGQADTVGSKDRLTHSQHTHTLSQRTACPQVRSRPSRRIAATPRSSIHGLMGTPVLPFSHPPAYPMIAHGALKNILS